MIPLLTLIVLVLVVTAIGVALILPRRRRLPSALPRLQFSENAPAGLFGNQYPAKEVETASKLRDALIARAAAGDKQTLVEASGTRDERLYSEVLDTLIEQASSCQEAFDNLVRHVLENDELRANPKLAGWSMERFKTAPNRRWAAELLHVAAKSDDAATFERALDTILQLWSQGRLVDLSADELRDLFESEYWVLGSEARRSGAGFALKQRLAEVRSQLAAASHRAGSTNS